VIFCWRRLACAILLRAARDALAGSAEAKHWLLFSRLAGDLVDELGLLPEVRRWVLLASASLPV